MTRTHNITGCEATHRDRLVAFSHVHGAMVWGAPRRTRRVRSLALSLIGGAAIWAALFALAAILSGAHPNG